MEIRVLRYFLEVAREENITRAAKHLHISQPTLSRQLKDLEAELGKKLFVRTNYSVHLTDEGILLRKRAEDIIDMVDKTTDEFKSLDEINGGDIYIGCAESEGMKYFFRILRKLQEEFPGIRCHVFSSATDSISERLDKGLLDFAIIVEEVDLEKYNFIKMPVTDCWGALLRKDHPLAKKDYIEPTDLLPYPIISSRQGLKKETTLFFGDMLTKVNIAATYDLIYNASVMVRENIGIALGFERLIYTGSESKLCFKPLRPSMESPMYIIWKKYQIFSPVADLLFQKLQQEFKQ